MTNNTDPVRVLPIETAPRDGTIIRLLVEFEDHATEDTEGPAWTIGHNSRDNTGDDEWQFAGWCWNHDHYTEGRGKPVGWLPMVDPLASAPPSAPDRMAIRMLVAAGFVTDAKANEALQIAHRFISGPLEPPSAPVGAAEDMVLDGIERRGSSAPVGVEGLAGAQGFLDWNRSQAKPPVRIGQEYAVYEAALAQQPAAPSGEVVGSDDRRERLLERRNVLNNSFGNGAYEDGRVQQQIDAIDAELAALAAPQQPAGVDEVRPLDDWHEDDGPVVWWTFPVNEPAWIGSPTDSDWPGYHTHWTPHPAVPPALAAQQQGGLDHD